TLNINWKHVAQTECSHVFSESTNWDLRNYAKREYAGNAWTIIEHFGYPNIRKELEGHGIHSLRNILTLHHTLHSYFDKLKLWLVPTTPNRYQVETSIPLIIFNSWEIPRIIEFQTTQPDLDLPSADYLHIHAACCRVYHMSGAANLRQG
ncbi:uncharacterized protein PHACADRAFT_109576, partial [Phanerochaete carnosa HHB-10118-sp]